MNLQKVTITGADNSIKPYQLRQLSVLYPFVEWGILMSKASAGRPRFPTLGWIDELMGEQVVFKSHLSAHICGRWVRDICEGKWTILEERSHVLYSFERIQLNFHAEVHKLKLEFTESIKRIHHPFQFIFQLDDVNNAILDAAVVAGVNAVPLFDTSGGAGVLPGRWPVARGTMCGYAGGLSPDNVVEQLGYISKACGDIPIWIDCERRVRSEDDQQFDLDKVEKFLQAAEPFLNDEIRWNNTAIHPDIQ